MLTPWHPSLPPADLAGPAPRAAAGPAGLWRTWLPRHRGVPFVRSVPVPFPVAM